MTTTLKRGSGAGRATRIIPMQLLAVLAAFFIGLGAPASWAGEAGSGESALSTVNINTADASTLAAALKGVGLSRAEEIVRYREQFGPFTTVEQLGEVKGIGSATLEQNRTRITLD